MCAARNADLEMWWKEGGKRKGEGKTGGVFVRDGGWSSKGDGSGASLGVEDGMDRFGPRCCLRPRLSQMTGQWRTSDQSHACCLIRSISIINKRWSIKVAGYSC